jgi:hypothetical protein
MIIDVHATDWSVNQCRPIAQQSAKIVTIRPTHQNTFMSVGSDMRTSIQRRRGETWMSRINRNYRLEQMNKTVLILVR